jgi:hypothetical protein
VLKKDDENILRRVERKIIRKICGPIQEEEQWTIRNNEEMDEILKKEDSQIYNGKKNRLAGTRRKNVCYQNAMVGVVCLYN